MKWPNSLVRMTFKDHHWLFNVPPNLLKWIQTNNKISKPFKRASSLQDPTRFKDKKWLNIFKNSLRLRAKQTWSTSRIYRVLFNKLHWKREHPQELQLLWLLIKSRIIISMTYTIKLEMPKMIKRKLKLLSVLVKSVSSKTYLASPTSFKPFKVCSKIQMTKSDQQQLSLSVESQLETLLSS